MKDPKSASIKPKNMLSLLDIFPFWDVFGLICMCNKYAVF